MGDPLRIVSYNVRYFGHALRGLASTRTSKQLIAVRLADLQPLPDIVCLQEVETISMRSRAAMGRSRPVQTQLQDFMGELSAVFASRGQPFPYEAFYFRAHTYKVSSLPIYTTGLAILVNLDRLKVAGHNADAPHPITHHHVERFKDAKQSRICAHLKVSTNTGRVLHVFNTHLSLPTPFARRFWASKEKMGFGDNQLKEAQRLCSFVKQHAQGDPFVVCGDFNSSPTSPVFHYLTTEAGFTCAQLALNTLTLSKKNAFPTAGFMRLRMHLDHLFSGGPLQWVDLKDTHPFGHPENLFDQLSDHVPLIGRFDFPDL